MLLVLIVALNLLGSVLMYSTLYKINAEEITVDSDGDQYTRLMSIHVLSALWPVTMVIALCILLISFARAIISPK